MRMKALFAVLVFLVACGAVRADSIETISAALDFTSPNGMESELFATAFDWNGLTVPNMTFATSGALGSSFSFTGVLGSPNFNFDSFRWTDPNGDFIGLDFFEVNPEHLLIQPFLFSAGTPVSWTPQGEVSLSAPFIFSTPEPATVLLLGGSLVAVPFVALRHRKRAGQAAKPKSTTQ
jgi:hypothetical protein